MSRVGYLLDEHTPAYWPSVVQAAGPAIRIARIGRTGMPAWGTKDPELLYFCEENKLAWVTVDRRSLYGHLADHMAVGREFWGVLKIERPITVEEMVTDLRLIYEVYSAEELIGVVQALPL